jgi:hypothetical protein
MRDYGGMEQRRRQNMEGGVQGRTPLENDSGGSGRASNLLLAVSDNY